MKRILITGKNSYIGNSFKKWVSQWSEKYQVDEMILKDTNSNFDASCEYNRYIRKERIKFEKLKYTM